jgi:hypothetical protein
MPARKVSQKAFRAELKFSVDLVKQEIKDERDVEPPL